MMVVNPAEGRFRELVKRAQSDGQVVVDLAADAGVVLAWLLNRIALNCAYRLDFDRDEVFVVIEALGAVLAVIR